MRRLWVAVVVLAVLGLWAVPVWAATVVNEPSAAYVELTAPNSSVTDTGASYGASSGYMNGGKDASGAYIPITGVYLSWSVQQGDSGSLSLYDQNMSLISTDPISMSSGDVSFTGDWVMPSGVYFVVMTLNSGAASGSRYLYYDEIYGESVDLTTSYDALFPAPAMSDYVDGGTSSGGTSGGTTSDDDDLTLQQILAELNTMSGQLGVIINNLQVPLTVPQGASAPVVAAVVPSPPAVTVAVPGVLADPGGYNESGVSDVGGGSVSVAVPVYGVPSSVAAPAALPVSPDPSASLPAHDAPVPPVAVGSVDVNLQPVAVSSPSVLGSPDPVGNVATVGSVGQGFVPDSVEKVQSWSVDSYVQDAVRKADPVP